MVAGLRDGFQIGFLYEKSKQKKTLKNMQSAYEHPEVVSSYLQKECKEVQVVGPLHPEVKISLFGVILKKQPGAWRVILDLSSPEMMESVLICALCLMCQLMMQLIISLSYSERPQGLLSKIDIKNVYRIIPIHLDNRHLLGMK